MSGEAGEMEKGQTFPGRGRDLPVVSVIMPVRNEELFIRRSLGALLGQTYPHDRLEILIADGSSDDATREIIGEITAAHPGEKIRLLKNPRRIFSTGFNLGLREAQGDVIVMLGGHAELADDYVERCVVNLLRWQEFDCVGGYMATVGLTPVSQVIALALGSAFGVGGVGFRTKPDVLTEVDTVGFGAYRGRAVRRCGPLDEDLVHDQDDEYNYRLRDLGGRILLGPDIHATYFSRSSFGSVAQQYFSYGYWKVRVMQLHPRQIRLRHLVPPAFAATLLLGTLLSLFHHPAAVGLTALLGLYIVAIVAASGRLMLAARPRLGALLPVVFPVVHLSYGFGVLAGLVRFAGRWGGGRAQAGLKPGYEGGT